MIALAAWILAQALVVSTASAPAVAIEAPRGPAVALELLAGSNTARRSETEAGNLLEDVEPFIEGGIDEIFGTWKSDQTSCAAVTFRGNSLGYSLGGGAE